MFLPLGRVWSLDDWLERRRGGTRIAASQTRVISVASAAILLQMALMYQFSAIFKTNAAWLRGEAVAGILADAFYATPPGEHLRQLPRLLTGMTWGTLALEWAAAFLLFFPKGTPGLRIAVIAAMAMMHLGISLCMAVDLFTPVALAGLALFLPGAFWNSRLLRRLTHHQAE
jgi:hypothetical protein